VKQAKRLLYQSGVEGGRRRVWSGGAEWNVGLSGGGSSSRIDTGRRLVVVEGVVRLERSGRREGVEQSGSSAPWTSAGTAAWAGAWCRAGQVDGGGLWRLGTHRQRTGESRRRLAAAKQQRAITTTASSMLPPQTACHGAARTR